MHHPSTGHEVEDSVTPCPATALAGRGGFTALNEIPAVAVPAFITTRSALIPRSAATAAKKLGRRVTAFVMSSPKTPLGRRRAVREPTRLPVSPGQVGHFGGTWRIVMIDDSQGVVGLCAPSRASVRRIPTQSPGP